MSAGEAASSVKGGSFWTDKNRVKFLASVRLPYVVLLAVAALSVSIIGAVFSVSGLAKMFSGASLAVMFMAGALEFAKVVTAAFLHQNWRKLGFMLKTYLSVAVAVLVMITSMGIYGYLTHAYQKSSVALRNAQIRLEGLQKEESQIQAELARIQKAIDAVPDSRVTRKLELQKEFEPGIQRLKARSVEINQDLQKVMVERQLYMVEIGPMIYVAEAFDLKIDQVAKWFIGLFVCVFDPLAICLVMATSWSLHRSRDEEDEDSESPNLRAVS